MYVCVCIICVYIYIYAIFWRKGGGRNITKKLNDPKKYLKNL